MYDCYEMHMVWRRMRFVALFFLCSTFLLAAERPIRIAPLPMVQSEVIVQGYQSLIAYLEAELGIPFELVYYADYDLLLQKIAEKEIDIAFLGPLPYIELTRRTSDVRPMIRFVEADGDDTYTCTLFTTDYHAIDTIKELRGRKIALTQRYSTCGYLAVERMLNESGESLQNMDYRYTGSHTNVILDVTMGDFDAGSAKTSIVKKYAHLGLKKLKESPRFPGFLWVSSTALDANVHEKIKRLMLSLDPRHNPEHAKITAAWIKNIRFGAVEAKDSDYDAIRGMLKSISIPE